MSIPITKFGELEKEITELEEEAVPLPFIVDNFLGKNGGEITGSIDMTGQPIKNLPDPVDGQDAVTKNYVDSSQGHSFFRRSPRKGYIASKDLNMGENRLLGLAMPVDNLEASNKLYVDITTNDVKNALEGQNPFVLNGVKHKARGDIDMLNFKVENVPMPVEDKDVSNKIFTETLVENRRRQLEANNPFNLEGGDFVAKNKIDMKGNKIENVGFPNLPNDVVTVAFFDEANVWERKNGGFVAKDHIYLGKKKLGGIRDPTTNGEAINLKFFTEKTEELRDYIDEKTEEIKASAISGDINGNVDEVALNAVKAELEKNQAFNTRNGKTFNARGNLNMKKKSIRNLPSPTEESEAVPLSLLLETEESLKTEIEEIKKKDLNAFEREGEYIKSKQTILIGGKTIEQLGKPNFLTDAVNLEYLQEKLKSLPFTKVNGHFFATNEIDMGVKRIKNLALPVDENDAINRIFLEDKVKPVEDRTKTNTEKIEELKIEDGKRKTETDRIRVLVNDKVKDVEEKIEENYKKLEKYADKASGFSLSPDGDYWAKGQINMLNNPIKNLGFLGQDNEAMPKKFVDKEIERKVKPVENQTKTNTEEIEKLKVEDRTRKDETEWLHRLIKEKVKELDQRRNELKEYIDIEKEKILPKEKIFKFLGTSIILIRGETAGPIVGMEEVLNSNIRKPAPDLPGGFIAYDRDRKEIKPSIVYFGKYDGGDYDNKESDLRKPPMFLIPSIFKILKYGIFFEGLNKKVVISEEFGVYGDVPTKESFNLTLEVNFQNGNSNEKKIFLINTGTLEYDKMHCKVLDNINSTIFQNCNSLFLNFRNSHINVSRFFITFVVLLHLPDLNKDYLPDGFDIV